MLYKYTESNESNPQKCTQPIFRNSAFKQAIYGFDVCAVIVFGSAVVAKTPAELMQIKRVRLISLICCLAGEERTRGQPSWKFFSCRHGPLVIWTHNNHNKRHHNLILLISNDDFKISECNV